MLAWEKFELFILIEAYYGATHTVRSCRRKPEMGLGEDG